MNKTRVIKTLSGLTLALVLLMAGSSARTQTGRISTLASEGFELNYGLSGSWANPDSPGQGFFFDVNPETHLFWMSWFTFGQAAAEAASVIGFPDNRWFVGLGTYTDASSEVSLTILETEGGVFDGPVMVSESSAGTISLSFNSCSEAVLAFSFNGGGVEGQVPIQRLTSTEVCDALAATP